MPVPDLLSSDILESQFGPTELEVLSQDGQNRTILTRATDTGQVLEFSRVTFRPEGIAAFPEIHAEILAGKSMGRAFADRHIKFTREVQAAYKQDPDPELMERFGSPAKATVIEVSILIGPQRLPYADILETYSPAVKTLKLAL